MTWNMVRNTEKRKKWKKQTVGPAYGKKPEKRGKWEMHTVGPGIWREKLKKVENEKYTLYDLDYGEKHRKRWKMRNKHFMNMARNT